MILYPRHRTTLYPKHMAYQKGCKHKASIPSLHTKPRTSCPATHGPQAGKRYDMSTSRKLDINFGVMWRKTRRPWAAPQRLLPPKWQNP